MAQKSWFFNSAIGDPRIYQASDFAQYFGKVLSTGLLHIDEIPGLQVRAGGTDLHTYVEPGGAIMEGYAYENTDNEYLSHSLPEVGLDRIDRVVLRLDKKNANRYIKLFVIEGEPSLNPVAPALQRDSLVWELSLAQVRIRANTSSINTTDVIDERKDRTVCGLVYSLISKPAPADIQTGGYSVAATTEGQKDFEIPLKSFDIVGDGLTVYVGGDKAPFNSYELIYPRTVRFKVGKPVGTLVEFDIIRGRVLLEDDYVVTAGEVGIVDGGNYFVAENVEGALQQIGNRLFAQKPKVYGVKIDFTNNHSYDSVSYIDDAKEITNPNDWNNRFPFNQIKPCMVRNGVFQFYLNPLDYSKKIDGTPSNHTSFDNGDVMIEIPKMYWSFSKDSNFNYFRISDSKVDDTFEAIPFKKGNTEYNHIYLSAYAACEGADGNLYSISGKTFKSGLTVESARSKISGKGSNYQQIGLAQIFLWQALFILRYKWLNSDLALGVAPSVFRNVSGFTDSMGMYAGSGDNTVPFKFIGIEQMVSANHVLVDGYFSSEDSGYTNIGSQFSKTDITDFEYFLPERIRPVEGYIRDMSFNNKFPFVPIEKISARTESLSASVFYSDNARLSSFGRKYSGLSVQQYDNGIFSWGGVALNNPSQARFVCFI